MEDNRACFDLIWLPAENELPALISVFQSKEPSKLPAPLNLLKNFFKRLFSRQVSVHDFKPKINCDTSNISTSMFFAEYLFNVTCSVEWEYSLSDDSMKVEVYKKLIDLICSGKPGSIFPELYLSIDPWILVNNYLSTVDSFIDLKSFSLGNIVKLNVFVEHFNSVNSLTSYKYKITQVKVKFLHDAEIMQVNFFVCKSKGSSTKSNQNSHRMFKFEITYSSLHSILVCNAKDFSVFFHLYKSPTLLAVKQDEDDDTFISYMTLSIKTPFVRTVDIFEDCPADIKKQFSMNTVLCLNFPHVEYEMLKIMLYHKSVQIYFTSMNIVPYQPVQLSLEINDYECYYAIQCLLTLSYELLDQLLEKKELDEFRKLIKNNACEKSKSSKTLSEALYKIHSALSKCNVVLLNYSIKQLLKKLSSTDYINYTDEFYNSEDEKQQNSVLLVKRAIIIPTHIRFLPPHPILKSRALRKCNPDYSLRLTIRDVTLQTINFSFGGFGQDKKTELTKFFEKYYKKPLLNGFKVGKRHYKYVGSSTSQLRGHGLWYYAKDDKGRTAQTLRESLGQFDEIKEVSKYMARMGQSFSQSRGNIIVPQKYTNNDNPEEDIKGGVKVYLPEEDMENCRKQYLKAVEDIQDEKNRPVKPYNFSDGIGRISPELAEEVYKKLNLEEKPAAMQIRYAGCKGMLVVDPRLKGKQILFRLSMRKFFSNDESLEILKVSEPRVASLNRPLITILEQLGVKKEVFTKLQKEMIQNYIKSMFYEPEACEFLHRNSKLRFDFLRMHANGICFTEDPLFRSMIFAIFQRQLELLKTKANIEIPPDKGRSMFGVLDETNTLEYGQVFIQYTSFKEKSKRVVCTGTVVVTKNPCMHPGDVRKFEAIDVPDLHHICDCIVFPAKGPRPHPDEMAGSDLDGDEYHVMWYKDFIFERSNVPAMHYAMPEDTEKKDNENGVKFQIDDELKHLCDYIVNDNVGLIASAHLAFADKHPEGIFSENCMRLARKYAIALDFAKSGKTASRDKADRISSYPDFMQKFGEKKTYLSKKALGVLFRNCKRLEMGLETSNPEVVLKLDSDLIYENWQEYKNTAKETYKYYCRKMEYLMNAYSFATEGELLTGSVINPPKYYDQRHDLENLMTFLEYQMQEIFKYFENIFFLEFNGKPKNKNFTKAMYQKASAWYVVTYDKDKTDSSHFFGLPWAVTDVLIELKKMNYRAKNNKPGNYKSLLEDTIDKRLSSLISLQSTQTPVNDIFENRLEVLDVAGTVLNKWLNTHKDHVLIEDLKKFKRSTEAEFMAVSDVLQSCNVEYIKHLKETNDLKKALSPAYYIIETLLRLASIKFPLHKSSFLDVQQELSLLSWVTLIKLASTYNPDYLGIGEVTNSMYLLPRDNIVTTFKVHLFDEDEYNQDFSLKLLIERGKVVDYLLKVSQVKEIDFRYDQDHTKFVAVFTVMGSRYAIEKLKDIVIQEHFCMWVVKDQRLFATQSKNVIS